ncbi:hypothetical protein [Natronospora cellulosivora (SeqCode)]
MTRQIDNLAPESLDFIKEIENTNLYLMEQGINLSDHIEEFALAVHYDGKENYAIGFGLDLFQNSWATIRRNLDSANDNSADDFDYETPLEITMTNADGEVVREEYLFQDLINNYQDRLEADFRGDENRERMRVLQRLMAMLKEDRVNNIDVIFPDPIRVGPMGSEVVYSNRENSEIYNLVRDFFYEIISPLIHFRLF